jgi:hypothetical protein
MSLFTSTPEFNRCVPDLSQFVCGSSTECNNAKNGTSVSTSEVYDGLMSAFNAIRADWWILLVCITITVIISFLWMFVLRRIVKPMVVVTMVLLVAAIGLVGGLLFHWSRDPSKAANKNYYFYGAIACWVVDFLVLCVILYVRKDVMLACDIIEEASKIPLSLPTMMFVPLVATISIVPFVIFFMFSSAAIYTAANTVDITVSTPRFLANKTFDGYSTNVSRQYQFTSWRVYAEIYNLLIFLWTVGFLHAIGYMTLAFCAIFWYWSAPGDEKKPEAGVCAGFGLTMRNPLGSIAIGSLILAVIQVLRVLMNIIEGRMSQYAQRSETVKFLLCCVECCLACFHRVVKFLTHNIYIMQAMTGESFLDAARHALHLLLQNALSVAAISIVGEWICMFGKILITALVVLIAYGICTTQTTNTLLVLIIVGLVAYFITCVFVNVFHVCIDAVLLSYCYDLAEHDGQSKPYYFPSDLAKHVEGAKARMAEKAASNAKAKDLCTPINKV